MSENSKAIHHLPASCLAEYITRRNRSAESVLRPYKFRTDSEGRARTCFRPPVVNVIRKFYRFDSDRNILDSAIIDWRKRADATDKKGQRTRFNSNIAALNLFRVREWDRHFEVLPIRRISCQIGPIVFTASPDLWIKENGEEQLIKMGFGRKNRSYVDILLIVIRAAALAHGHAILPRNVIYLNFSTGERLVSNFAYEEVVETLLSSSREIAKVWPRVMPVVSHGLRGERSAPELHDRAGN